jgi:hypothetical protein
MATYFSLGRYQRSVALCRRNGPLLMALLCGLCLCPLLRAADGVAPARLTAAQIVDRNIAARGGLSAWHAVQTMSWSGKMDAGSADSTARSAAYVSNATGTSHAKAKAMAAAQASAPAQATVAADKQVQLPFTLAMERPHKSHLEIEFAGKTAVQVYDGTSGWKLLPFLNRNDVEAFTPDEAKSEAREDGIEGPLLDYATKGAKVELEAMDKVEGRDAYRLRLTKKDGDVQHIWIDAQSFLDVKVQATQRRMDGRMRDVWVYQRDFRPEQGLMIPHVLETAVDGYRDTHKVVIEKVSVNPKLNEALFAKPIAPAAPVAPVARKG